MSIASYNLKKFGTTDGKCPKCGRLPLMCEGPQLHDQCVKCFVKEDCSQKTSKEKQDG